MGAPDFEMQQQQMQVQKAYLANEPNPVKTAIKKEAAKDDCTDMFEGIKVDGIDQAYIWVRTFTPSWVAGIALLIGFYVILAKTLEKFGIKIKMFSLEKKS